MSSDEYRTVRATVTLANGAVRTVYAGAVASDDDLSSFKRRARSGAVEEAAHEARTGTSGARVAWVVEGGSE